MNEVLPLVNQISPDEALGMLEQDNHLCPAQHDFLTHRVYESNKTKFGVIYYAQTITATVNKQSRKIIPVTLLPDPRKRDWQQQSLSESVYSNSGLIW